MRTSIAFIVSLSTLLLQVNAATINNINNSGDGTISVVNGVTVLDGTTASSCPGVAALTQSGSGSGAFCCVEKDPATVTASTCAGFPFCSSSESNGGMTIVSASCETLIPFSASNYAQLVGSATSSMSGKIASTSATAAPASTSATAAKATSTSSGTSSSSTSISSEAAASTTTKNSAAVMGTVPPRWRFIGLGVVAGILAAAF